MPGHPFAQLVTGGVIALGLLLASSWAAGAQDASLPPVLKAPAPALRGEDLSADTSGDVPAVGIPARSLFRDTGNTYLSALRQKPEADAGFNAGSLQLHTQLSLGSSLAQLPLLRRGLAPEDADLKLGPAYFKLHSASAALLFSDNVNLTNRKREAGVIAISQLGASIILQVTETLQFVGTGYFVYFPLEGKAGLLGTSDLGSNYSFALAALPAFYSQLTYDTNLAGWPVLFSDEFSAGIGSYTASPRDDNELFVGGGFRGEDRAGRYVFRAPVVRETNLDDTDNRRLDDRDRRFQYYSNRVGLQTERLLPHAVRLRARVYHENLWYNQGGRGLPSIREDGLVSLTSEQPNLRFKPFLSYEVFRASLDTGFNQTALTGFSGPLTDQLQLSAVFGYFRSTRGQGRLLGGVSLQHQAGPYTTEGLAVGQETSFSQDEIFTYQTYFLSQVLGPRLNGRLFATHETVEDLVDGRGDRDEWLAGVQLTLVAGPRTTVSASGIYTHSSGLSDFHTWTGRLELRYHFAETLDGRLFYQFQRRDGDFDRDRYRENLVLVELTKSFN